MKGEAIARGRAQQRTAAKAAIHRAQIAEWKRKNADRVRAKDHEYYERTKEKKIIAVQSWQAQNKAAYVAAGTRSASKARAEVADSYVKRRLVEDGLKKDAISKDLIEAKRQQILMRRLARIFRKIPSNPTEYDYP